FSKVLDGLEAAHLKGVVHRDLKPENILVGDALTDIVLSDFGVARFQAEDLLTAVETKTNARLANFQYASPEQKTRGAEVDERSDLFSLGLILNELFTSQVAQGTNYLTVGKASPEHSYLDAIVEKLLSQDPNGRPGAVREVRDEISRGRQEYFSHQKVSQIDATVIPENEVDDPLALSPPTVVGADWDDNRLTIELDQEVSPRWVRALQSMGNYQSVMGCDPSRFEFHGRRASVQVNGDSAQRVLDFFKSWLSPATQKLHHELQNELAVERQRREEYLASERRKAEERQKVLQNLKI
ncbi:MAG: protein kinase, partial [Alphaproteobacteria bacterium]|nr:protein kinase [Alphaproteobacteria bacterium]